MKALIKKYPINTNAEYKNEVMLEPWPECVQADINDYLDNYHYALCESVPDTPQGDEDSRLNVANYTVTAYEYRPTEDSEPITRYKATYSTGGAVE